MFQIKFQSCACFSPFQVILSGGINIDFNFKIQKHYSHFNANPILFTRLLGPFNNNQIAHRKQGEKKILLNTVERF